MHCRTYFPDNAFSIALHRLSALYKRSAQRYTLITCEYLCWWHGIIRVKLQNSRWSALVSWSLHRPSFNSLMRGNMTDHIKYFENQSSNVPSSAIGFWIFTDSDGGVFTQGDLSVYSDSSGKDAETKRSVPCLAPVSFDSSSNFKRARSGRICITIARCVN